MPKKLDEMDVPFYKFHVRVKHDKDGEPIYQVLVRDSGITASATSSDLETAKRAARKHLYKLLSEKK